MNGIDLSSVKSMKMTGNTGTEKSFLVILTIFFCGLEKLIEDYKTGVDTLCYFGSYFGCEPRGDRPEEFGVKLIFDVDLTKKIKAGEIHVGETDVV